MLRLGCLRSRKSETRHGKIAGSNSPWIGRPKDTVRQGAERQVSFPFVLCSDKELVSKGGSDGKEGVAKWPSNSQ